MTQLDAFFALPRPLFYRWWLTTTGWQIVRAYAYHLAGGVCEVKGCGQPATEGHHDGKQGYDALGTVREPDHVRMLCSRHHREIHRGLLKPMFKPRLKRMFGPIFGGIDGIPSPA